jgi:hypothetical protein
VPYHVYLFRVSIRRGFEKILRHTKSAIPPHLAWTWYVDAILKIVPAPMRVKMLSCISKPDHGTTSGSIQVPRQVGTEEKHFKYSPLPSHISNPIRLLILLPQASGTGIRCLLTVVSLDSSPKYEALSYVWGTASDRRDIEINGKILSVTSNLATALLYLRLEPKGDMYGDSSIDSNRILNSVALRRNEPLGRAIVLWVDALCIDQANNAEKNDQIKRMDVIFKKAERVICWLGPKRDTSIRALKTMRTWFTLQHQSLIEMIEDDPFDPVGFPTASRDEPMTRWLSHAIRNLPFDDLDALILLFQRPWWTRAWIIQEVALARHAVFMIGDEFIPFEILVGNFALGLRTVVCNSSGSSVKTEEDTGHRNNRKSTPFSPFLGEYNYQLKMVNRRRALFDVIRRPQLMFMFRCYATYGGKPSLADLITISRYQNATNPRDKIFAILGLLTSDHPCFGLVEPDYNISISRLYTRFAMRHIERSGTLDILGLVGDFDPDSKIPSWVPDWRMMPTNITLPFADITARPAFFMNFTKTLPIVPLYAAGLNAQTPVSFEFLFNEQVIRLMGVEVDKVTQMGDVCLLELGLKPREVIRSWKAIAGLSQKSLHAAEKQSTEASVEAKAGVDTSAANVEAFWRTILADEVLTDSHELGEYRKHLGSKIEGVSSIPPSSEEEEFSLLNYLMGDIRTLNMRHCANRRLFRTISGHIGLGPAHMVLGDVVAVVLGGRVPLILRQTLDFHSFIGER